MQTFTVTQGDQSLILRLSLNAVITYMTLLKKKKKKKVVIKVTGGEETKTEG